MALDAALADAQAAKRMRLTPELAGRAFQYQSMHVNQWGQMWPPITMVLGFGWPYYCCRFRSTRRVEGN